MNRNNCKATLSIPKSSHSKLQGWVGHSFCSTLPPSASTLPSSITLMPRSPRKHARMWWTCSDTLRLPTWLLLLSNNWEKAWQKDASFWTSQSMKTISTIYMLSTTWRKLYSPTSKLSTTVASTYPTSFQRRQTTLLSRQHSRGVSRRWRMSLMRI